MELRAPRRSWRRARKILKMSKEDPEDEQGSWERCWPACCTSPRWFVTRVAAVLAQTHPPFYLPTSKMTFALSLQLQIKTVDKTWDLDWVEHNLILQHMCYAKWTLRTAVNASVFLFIFQNKNGLLRQLHHKTKHFSLDTLQNYLNMFLWMLTLSANCVAIFHILCCCSQI